MRAEYTVFSAVTFIVVTLLYFSSYCMCPVVCITTCIYIVNTCTCIQKRYLSCNVHVQWNRPCYSIIPSI